MAELTYVLKNDLLEVIDADTLMELTGGRKAIGDTEAVDGDDLIWKGYINNAVEKVKGYSRHWYDMDTEMAAYQEYSVEEAFTAGQRVAGEETDGVRLLYTCILDAPVGTLLTNTDYFTAGDDRNSVLLEIASIFIVYNLHRRKNPRQIPEQRQIDYDNATNTLKDVQKGRLMLDIAERADVEGDDPGHEISYGDFEDESKDLY